MEYTTKDFKGYIVTGYLTSGKPFKPIHYSGDFAGYKMAFGINLYKCRVWGILHSGKRRLLKSVNC